MGDSNRIREAFERYDDDFLKFERIAHPRASRPDLCAFLLLHDLVPGTRDIVSDAAHDEIFLSTDVEKLAEVATDEDLLTLHRCGVRWSEHDCLAMFT